MKRGRKCESWWPSYNPRLAPPPAEESFAAHLLSCAVNPCRIESSLSSVMGIRTAASVRQHAAHGTEMIPACTILRRLRKYSPISLLPHNGTCGSLPSPPSPHPSPSSTSLPRHFPCSPTHEIDSHRPPASSPTPSEVMLLHRGGAVSPSARGDPSAS
jgi:hypothetical protein